MKLAATCLYVADVDASLGFYREAFGLEPRHHDKELEYAEIEVEGGVVALASHTLGEKLMPGTYERPAQGRPGGVEVAFLPDDVAEAFAAAPAAGATPLAEPSVMDWGWTLALVRAPDGTMIGLASPPAPDASTLPA